MKIDNIKIVTTSIGIAAEEPTSLSVHCFRGYASLRIILKHVWCHYGSNGIEIEL